MGPAIAVVDKDASYREHHLVIELRQLGFEAKGFAGEASLHRGLLARSFDVLVLGLDKKSDLKIARYMRLVSPIKIVVLTANQKLSALMRDVPNAMDLCLSKSISMKALAANLRCLARSIRRPYVPASVAWRLSEDGTQLISPSGRSLCVDAMESRLLARVLAVPGEVVLHADLVVELASESASLDQRRLQDLVCGLRRRAARVMGIPLPLRSIAGYGYRMQFGRVQAHGGRGPS